MANGSVDANPGMDTNTFNMLVHLLGGAGAAISGPGSVGASLGGFAQNMVGQQSYAEFLSMILGKGGKITADKEKTKLDFPSSALKDASPMYGGGGPAGGYPADFAEILRGGQAGGGQVNMGGQVGGTPNPFSSSQAGTSFAGLPGLTPQLMQQALNFGLMTRQLKRQKSRDLMEADYRRGTLGVQRGQLEARRTAADRKKQELDRQLGERQPITFGGHTVLLGPELIARMQSDPTSYKEYIRQVPKGELPSAEGYQKYLEKQSAQAEERPLRVSPMTIAGGTDLIKSSFGSFDASGRWATTPKLQAMYRKAQQFYSEYVSAGRKDAPAMAHEAETRARAWGRLMEKAAVEYHRLIKKHEGDEAGINEIQRQFINNFGDLPR